MRELAKQHTEAAIKTLAEITRSGSDRARVSAAESILDRGWGRPSQELHHVGDGSETPVIVLGWPEESGGVPRSSRPAEERLPSLATGSRKGSASAGEEAIR